MALLQMKPASQPNPVVVDRALKFANKRIGVFELQFEDANGEPIKSKKSDGYLSLKPRGGSHETRHFVIIGELPSKKVLMAEIEEAYSRSSDYKVHQVHISSTIR